MDLDGETIEGEREEGKMTQEERWNKRYDEVKGFIETNHRNPSKYEDAERGLRNWVRHQQKLVNKGDLKPERIEPFKRLMEIWEENKRINQY